MTLSPVLFLACVISWGHFLFSASAVNQSRWVEWLELLPDLVPRALMLGTGSDGNS